MPFYESSFINALRQRAEKGLPAWESPFTTDQAMFDVMLGDRYAGEKLEYQPYTSDDLCMWMLFFALFFEEENNRAT